eukprot:TRINITY_DN30285_c0_g1_i2.p1 TRINITY_DN30285_c0_g1~~TRINITY_DN30285_c0_g1_i2.p1  ORF type:complete len:894 (-),score=82.00 TRINITY_DN30285_c0_g1_i2:312-2822(-)
MACVTTALSTDPSSEVHRSTRSCASNGLWRLRCSHGTAFGRVTNAVVKNVRAAEVAPASNEGGEAQAQVSLRWTAYADTSCRTPWVSRQTEVIGGGDGTNSSALEFVTTSTSGCFSGSSILKCLHLPPKLGVIEFTIDEEKTAQREDRPRCLAFQLVHLPRHETHSENVTPTCDDLTLERRSCKASPHWVTAGLWRRVSSTELLRVIMPFEDGAIDSVSSSIMSVRRLPENITGGAVDGTVDGMDYKPSTANAGQLPNSTTTSLNESGESHPRTPAEDQNKSDNARAGTNAVSQATSSPMIQTVDAQNQDGTNAEHQKNRNENMTTNVTVQPLDFLGSPVSAAGNRSDMGNTVTNNSAVPVATETDLGFNMPRSGVAESPSPNVTDVVAQAHSDTDHINHSQGMEPSDAVGTAQTALHGLVDRPVDPTTFAHQENASAFVSGFARHRVPELNNSEPNPSENVSAENKRSDSDHDVQSTSLAGFVSNAVQPNTSESKAIDRVATNSSSVGSGRDGGDTETQDGPTAGSGGEELEKLPGTSGPPPHISRGAEVTNATIHVNSTSVHNEFGQLASSEAHGGTPAAPSHIVGRIGVTIAPTNPNVTFVTAGVVQPGAFELQRVGLVAANGSVAGSDNKSGGSEKFGIASTAPSHIVAQISVTSAPTEMASKNVTSGSGSDSKASDPELRGGTSAAPSHIVGQISATSPPTELASKSVTSGSGSDNKVGHLETHVGASAAPSHVVGPIETTRPPTESAPTFPLSHLRSHRTPAPKIFEKKEVEDSSWALLPGFVFLMLFFFFARRCFCYCCFSNGQKSRGDYTGLEMASTYGRGTYVPPTY